MLKTQIQLRQIGCFCFMCHTIMEWLTDPTALIGLSTLILLEVVLGIDNLVFIAILADKLPPHQRDKARLIGLSLALVMRLILLASISWLVTLTEPIMTIVDHTFSGRDLIFIGGGMFLLFKATKELHERLESRHHEASGQPVYASFNTVVAQIVVLDAVFSIDSVITAVGMANHLSVMMAAVIIAMIIMMIASRPLTQFVNARPTVIILCLGFLMMIGFSLIADGVGVHIPKGYLYAAIGFSILVEAFNQFARSKRTRIYNNMTLRDRTAEAVLRLLGGKAASAAVPTEIEDIVAGDAQSPVFDAEEMRMFARVMRLRDINIASVMTHRRDIVWIDVNEPRDSIQSKIRDSRHSRYPLCEGSIDQPLGILTVKELLLHLTDHKSLVNLMQQPITIPESITVLTALERFKQSTLGFAMVVDEYGSLQGIVTLKDIMEAIVGTLPEPKFREDFEGVQRDDGSWQLDGGLAIHEVEELLNVKLMGEKNEFHTLGGFIIFHLGHLPNTQDSFVWNEIRFEVTEMDRNRIEKVLVTPEIV